MGRQVILFLYSLRFDIDPNNREAFFTNAERSLVVQEILGRTPYTDTTEHLTAFGRYSCFLWPFIAVKCILGPL